MSTPKFCEQCGAALQPNTKFCEECGKPIAPITPTATPLPTDIPPVQKAAPPSTAPPRTAAPVAQAGAPRSNKRALLIGAVIVGGIALFACIALAAFGASKLFPSNTPIAQATSINQAALAPTSLATQAPLPTNAPATIVSPPTIASANKPTTAPTRAPTRAPTHIPTQKASPTPQCLPTPALPSGTLFSDNFASRQVSVCNGWELGNGTGSKIDWIDNQLEISVWQSNWVVFTSPFGKYADFGAETVARSLGNELSRYGLVFRLQEQNSDTRSYYFYALQNDGKYMLHKRVNGVWADRALVPLTASSLINPGTAQNTVGVIVRGSTIELYINRNLVKTITDDSITGPGAVGVVAATPPDKDTASAAFTSFRVLTPEQAAAGWGDVSLANAAPTNIPGTSKPAATVVSGPEEKFFEVWSKGAVATGGATAPTTFRIDKPWLVQELVTYHWNNGSGMSPGTIALKAADGTVYGPWNASGVAGNAGVANAAWSVKPNTVIPPGTYTVQDSDQASWSQNAETGGAGMAYGVGINQAPMAAAPTKAAPQAPPGVYLTALRVDPANPVRNQGVRFIGKFLNTTGKPQSMDWVVVIREPDAKKSFGETSVAGITVPVGTSEIASPDNWKVTGGGGCIPFYAQAFSVKADNSRVLLASTNGNAVSAGFNVCP